MAPPEKQGTGRTRRRILVGVVAVCVFIVLATIALILLPHGIRWKAQRWLRSHGQGNARIADIDFNPFTGRITIHDLTGGEAEFGRLDMGRADLDLHYLALLSQRISLGDATVEDVTLDIVRDAEGDFQVGSLSLNQGVDGAPRGGQPWEIGYGAVDVRNVTLRYADPHVAADVFVKHLHADPFAIWEPLPEARVTADLVLNGRPVAIEGYVAPGTPQPEARATLKVDALPLDWLSELLNQYGVEGLTGILSADTRIRGRFSPASLTFDVAQWGKLHVDNLACRLPQSEIRSAKLDWDGRLRLAGVLFEPLFNARGVLDLGDGEVRLPSVGLAVTHEKFSWNGEADFALTGLPGSVECSLSVEGLSVADLDSASAMVELETLRLEEAAVSLEGTAEQIEVRAKVPVKASGIKVRVAPAALDIAQSEFAWDGTFEYGTAMPGAMRLQGDLDAQGLTIDDADGAWGSIKVGRVQLKEHTTDTIPAESGTRVAAGAWMFLDNLAVQLPASGIDLSQKQANWQGNVLHDPDNANEVAVDGELHLADIGLRMASANLGISQSQLSWQGGAAYDLGEDGGFTAQGELNGKDLSIGRIEEELSLAQAAAWRAAGFCYDGDAGAEMVEFDNVMALERTVDEGDDSPSHLATAETVAFEGVAVSSTELASDALRLSGLDARITITPEGELELAGMFPRAEEAPQEPEASEPTESSRFTVRFGQVELADDSSLVFRDESATSPVELVLEPFNLTVAPLDFAKPDTTSTIALRGKLGEYASIAVDGTVAPLARPLTLDLTGTIASLDLPPLTPYAERAVGYRLNSGMLDADVSVRLDAGKLDSKADLLAKGFVMERVDEDLEDQIAEQLGLSLSSALGLLRNEEDEIRLTVPVTGDLADLDVGVGDAVRQATMNGVMKALKAGAMAYLTPVGAVVVAGKMAKQATAVRFEPVAFEPGDSELGPYARTHLDEMARLLLDRKGIKLTLTGVAVSADISQREVEAPPPRKPGLVSRIVSGAERESDGQEGDEAETDVDEKEVSRKPLLELATTRANAVKEYLVSTGGVDPDRLVVTLPEVDEEPDAQPRVEVGL